MMLTQLLLNYYIRYKNRYILLSLYRKESDHLFFDNASSLFPDAVSILCVIRIDLTTILTTIEPERIVHESAKRKTGVIFPDKRALNAAERP